MHFEEIGIVAAWKIHCAATRTLDTLEARNRPAARVQLIGAPYAIARAIAAFTLSANHGETIMLQRAPENGGAGRLRPN